MPYTKRIALTGYSGSGKSTAGKFFIEQGYTRSAPGDIIKAQTDLFIQQHLGFSAFTEDAVNKKKIRQFLEGWGVANYENIFKAYFASMPEKCVNTRLLDVRQAEDWKKLTDGEIWEIVAFKGPVTAYEQDSVQTLRSRNLIDKYIYNTETVEKLYDALFLALEDASGQRHFGKNLGIV